MIYIIIYLLLETLISVEISSQIGGLNTFFEMILTVLIGIFIIKNFKHNLFSTMQDFTTGGIDINQLKSRNIFPMVGAIFLIIPGFLTDFIGVLFQLSFFTDLLVKQRPNPFEYKTEFKTQENFQNMHFQGEFNKSDKKDFKYDDDIIDVEILDKDKKGLT